MILSRKTERSSNRTRYPTRVKKRDHSRGNQFDVRKTGNQFPDSPFPDLTDSCEHEKFQKRAVKMFPQASQGNM